MRTFVRFNLSAIWLLLMLITALAGRLADVHGNERWARLCIAGLIAEKLYLVMNYFMELKEAPPVWRVAFVIWLCGAAGIMISIA